MTFIIRIYHDARSSECQKPEHVTTNGQNDRTRRQSVGDLASALGDIIAAFGELAAALGDLYCGTW